MFADASALTAMVTDESDARALLARLQNHPRRTISPLVVWETVIAVARLLGLSVRDSESAVGDYLKLTGIAVVAVAAETHAIAIEAYSR